MNITKLNPTNLPFSSGGFVPDFRCTDVRDEQVRNRPAAAQWTSVQPARQARRHHLLALLAVHRVQVPRPDKIRSRGIFHAERGAQPPGGGHAQSVRIVETTEATTG